MPGCDYKDGLGLGLPDGKYNVSCLKPQVACLSQSTAKSGFEPFLQEEWLTGAGMSARAPQSTREFPLRTEPQEASCLESASFSFAHCPWSHPQPEQSAGSYLCCKLYWGTMAWQPRKDAGSNAACVSHLYISLTLWLAMLKFRTDLHVP